MADRQVAANGTDQRRHHITARTLLFSAVAGAVIAGPLVALMALSFLATATFLLVISPLLVIFSPILLGAGLVVGVALTGFAAAATMGIAGVSVLAWGCRSFGADLGKVKEQGKELAGYLQQKGHGKGN